MPSFIIDPPAVTAEDLRSISNPALREVVAEAIAPTRPMVDSRGFNNRRDDSSFENKV